MRNGGIQYFRRGVLVGSVRMQMKRVLTLNPKKLKFSEKDSFKVLAVTGEGVGTSLDRFTVLCGKRCKAKVTFTRQSLTLGKTFNASVAYTSTVRSRKRVGNRSVYGLIFNHPTFGMEDVIVQSAPYRCDRQLTSNTAGGCVFHQVRPVLTSMQALPEISKNIARIQAAGKKHYGSRKLSKGRHPLTRLTNEEARRANRELACPASRRDAAPAGMQCDEYPFASTRQGAANVPTSEWGWAYVPAGENIRQGGLVNKFYSKNRILRGDAFWVRP
ncbi:NucA/NucB deoxyribonuclease domain-containing protein [Kineosporia succinea]|uniref:Deoxyribonuclease NucA/NucB domain-containing protein n=1 Tax=Kineosporia succinea TaxID=84632 RepID=A0ABT9NX68_9ACTN|nr:NucA/NucB deoxyribonuclease domain-containing protein [Kineosporia succinea]MDP9825025.1 hypothetical protein [Kineosporia succinea]